MEKLKKILPLIVFISLIVMVIIGIASKDKLNQYVSSTMANNVTPETVDRAAAYVDSAFNYSKNTLNFEVSFLEFGATGCVACRKMENVMEEVKQLYPDKVNVVFFNILQPENVDLMQYYGVVAIPTQILLDKEGREFFRHTGFIETEQLISKF